MRDADLSKLYPPVRVLVEEGLRLAHNNGLFAYPFEVFRTTDRQRELYKQGRITKGPIVTWVQEGFSFHEYGLAIDLVFDSDLTKPGPQWTWTGNYKSLASIMHSVGMETIPKEQAHFQKSYGLKIIELKRIRDKFGLVGVWKHLDQLRTSQGAT